MPEAFCDLLMSWRRKKKKRKGKLKEEGIKHPGDKEQVQQKNNTTFSQTSGTCRKHKCASIISMLSMHTQGLLQLLRTDKTLDLFVQGKCWH